MMKRLIALLLSLSILCLPVEARRRWSPKIVAGGFTARDSFAGTVNNDSFVGFSAPNQWCAIPFVATASYTLTKLDATFWKTGTPSYSVAAFIYTDSTGSPGTQVGSATSFLTSSVSATATPGATVTITGFSSTITNGTTYWMVYQTPSVSGSNYLHLALASSTLTAKTSPDGTTWSNDNTNVQTPFQAYSTP